MKKKLKTDRISLLFFVASAAFIIFCYGVAVGKYQIFPYQIVSIANKGFIEIEKQLLRTGFHGKLAEKSLPWYYRRATKPFLPPIYNTGQAFQGLNLITKVAAGLELSAEVVDMDGRKVHTWAIDWFKIWPNPEHIPKEFVPKSKPGTIIHGVAVLENGDLVFNFEDLGLVRLDQENNVVWRLPYQTHHSVHVHDDGSIWVCGQKRHTEPDVRFPLRIPPFDEYTLLEVTPEGKIRKEWSVADILRENGFSGLLYLRSLEIESTNFRGDTLHLNDVEPFPDTMKEDFFEKGDILVSLRNIDTVFVFNRRSQKIKFICTGRFVKQHDPDFIDGNRFSVFDNNTIASEDKGQQSRIIIVSARNGTSQIYYEGSRSSPFYTDIMGKHQWLPNCNLLITESRQGRAFEINRRGEVVWEFVNYVGDGIIGVVSEVQRLPSDYARLFIAHKNKKEKG